MNIYVSNLNFRTRGESLQTLFGEYGEVSSANIITDRETGHEGFGFDPLFVPDGYDRTFAEMTTEEKNAVSHRARAVRKLADYLHSIGK